MSRMTTVAVNDCKEQLRVVLVHVLGGGGRVGVVIF